MDLFVFNVLAFLFLFMSTPDIFFLALNFLLNALNKTLYKKKICKEKGKHRDRRHLFTLNQFRCEQFFFYLFLTR